MLEKYYEILNKKAKNNYTKNMGKIDKLIEEAEEIFKKCHFCEHKCYVNRNENKGRCGVKNTKISSHFFHYGEEKVLIPSYTIFFSGCNFSCIYCQNWDISQFESGSYIEPKKMAILIEKAEINGARNINWVGGEPTPHLLYILKVLKNCNSNLPQIWNSNMYCSLETMEILKHVIDLYLTDFKYGNNHCAKKLSNIDRYLEIITRNHEIAYKQGEVIVRHLVLPSHIDCCSKPVIDWISENIPNALVNIMDQYYPTYKAHENEEINRRLTEREYNEVYLYALKKGIKLI
ncbi:MAG: 4Fe-4S cluster-binding domain-containing protein [Thermoplasmatales archaeon]|nr:4Fe-4S cluster-binding domain-containing protein [Thermoplasmatales archaeon]